MTEHVATPIARLDGRVMAACAPCSATVLSHIPRLAKRGALVCLLSALVGCPSPGQGEGWVLGKLWVQNCDGGKPLSPDEDFDLRVNFYAGDLLFDSNDSLEQRRSRLTVRIQETSNNIEEANGIVLHFYDVVQAAQSLLASKPIPFTDDSLCPGCTDINPALRMKLNLFLGCPDNRASLAARAVRLEDRSTTGTSREERCLLPSEDVPPACPLLSAEEQDLLDSICGAEDFNDVSHRADIERVLGAQGQACLYLCEFGPIPHTGDPEQLLAFELDYGDTVSALFAATVSDTRAIRLNRCARANGLVSGMFRFRLVRSRVAQPFP